ncbi:MAG: glycine--tRNA ligase subunit beta, partial [Holosporaceae bacterium]|nr:glycine--tRNA ligase subunit beta [Holosporaceae bacterium]
MSKKDFLLEIMVEEIPSRFQSSAVDSFANLLISGFEKFRIAYENPVHYITPRRMVFGARLNPEIPGFTEEKKGPQVTAPAKTIDGFLKSINVSRDCCNEKVIDKKTFLVANVVHEPGVATDFLDVIVRDAVVGIPWPKSMHWGPKMFRFVRPITHIMCVFDGKLMPIGFDEIGLQSRDFTTGHLFMHRSDSGESLHVTADIDVEKIYAGNITEYLEKLREAFVIVDPEERKRVILQSVSAVESRHCGVCVEVPDALMNEIVGLVEYPVVFFADIPDKFMRLPEEAIIVPMRVHQRYFPTRMVDSQKLAPHFVFVANTMP